MHDLTPLQWGSIVVGVIVALAIIGQGVVDGRHERRRREEERDSRFDPRRDEQSD